VKKVIITVLSIVLALSFSVGAAAYCAVGSRGDEVKEVQTKLKELGYYSGKIDGVFGILTKNAVTAFQKDNGLKQDGIVGEKTKEALSVQSSQSSADTEYKLLARIISAEARGEEYIGQVAVGAVILNRVEHPSFPDTLSQVVFQNGAFSCLNDGQFYEEVSDTAYKAARDALNGMDPTGGAIYYYNPEKSSNSWIRSRPVITTIGKHVFCA